MESLFQSSILAPKRGSSASQELSWKKNKPKKPQTLQKAIFGADITIVWMGDLSNCMDVGTHSSSQEGIQWQDYIPVP